MGEVVNLVDVIDERRCRYFMALQAELAEVVKKHIRYGATPNNAIGACGILMADLIAKIESEKALYLREIVYDFIDKSTDERIQKKLEEYDNADKEPM